MVQGVIIENNHIIDCNPATNKEIARVKCTTPDEISIAIENARSAQQEWAEMSLQERVALVEKACSFWNSEDGGELKMAELITREMVGDLGYCCSETITKSTKQICGKRIKRSDVL
jgi:acyl-CoA reductase-like NAD-dependent aldehyde dehydrogenase